MVTPCSPNATRTSAFEFIVVRLSLRSPSALRSGSLNRVSTRSVWPLNGVRWMVLMYFRYMYRSVFAVWLAGLGQWTNRRPLCRADLFIALYIEMGVRCVLQFVVGVARPTHTHTHLHIYVEVCVRAMAFCSVTILNCAVRDNAIKFNRSMAT